MGASHTHRVACGVNIYSLQGCITVFLPVLSVVYLARMSGPVLVEGHKADATFPVRTHNLERVVLNPGGTPR